MKTSSIIVVGLFFLLFVGIGVTIVYNIPTSERVIIQGKLLSWVDSVSFYKTKLFFDTGQYDLISQIDIRVLHVNGTYRVVDYFNIFRAFLREELQEWY